MESSNLISIVLYFFIIAITIFILIYASLQIRNFNDIVTTEYTTTRKIQIIKWSIIILLCILVFIFFYKQIFNEQNQDNVSSNNKYKNTLINLQKSLAIKISSNDSDIYNSSEELAQELIFGSSVKQIYYFETETMQASEFTQEKIYKYNLKSFQNNPTILRNDGLLISIIKFNKGCQNIDIDNIENSDCVIEADANNFSPPNIRGQDRALFAINGNYNIIKTDMDFFNE